MRLQNEITRKIKTIKPQHLKKYENKIYSEELIEKLNETPDKMIDWLLN